MNRFNEMDFPVILAQSLAFSKGELGIEEPDLILRHANASLQKLPNLGTGVKVCEESGGSSGCHPSQGSPGTLSVDLSKSLEVHIVKDIHELVGYLTVWTTKSNADYYEQLMKASGGKLFVDIKFELETATGNYKLNVNEKKVAMFQPNYDWDTTGPAGLAQLLNRRFIFTASLSEAWRDTGNTFTGKLSVNLKLNDNLLGGFLRFGEEVDNPLLPVNKRMKMDETFTDATLVPGNEEGIKCHKIVLIANSDVFRKMFEAKMKEGLTSTVKLPDMCSSSVQALLDYLYCKNITKASESATLALELLMKAEEYAIEGLEKAMLQLIDAKGNDWFPVRVALHLFQFGRNKFENEGLLIYQLVTHKAAVVLKSKSKEEIDECPEFKEFFKNAENGAELCTYLICSI